MTLFDDDEFGRDEDLGIGRPGPQDPALLTARQLVAACQEARGADDVSYAASETEAFLEAQGDHVDDVVLLELLGLPTREALMQALIDLADAIAQRAPAIVPAVYAVATGGATQARATAETVLRRLPPSDYAAGLVLILQDEAAGRRQKEHAGKALLGLVRSAPSVLLDALAEPEVRTWLIELSGASASATDTELMRRFFAGTA
jgi:hypothetical protein